MKVHTGLRSRGRKEWEVSRELRFQVQLAVETVSAVDWRIDQLVESAVSKGREDMG